MRLFNSVDTATLSLAQLRAILCVGLALGCLAVQVLHAFYLTTQKEMIATISALDAMIASAATGTRVVVA